MLATMLESSVAPGDIRPISRKEFERMVDLGMFADERVELLRGLLVKKVTQGWLHARVVAWFTEELIRALDRSYEVRPQVPFPASDWSEPEPDVAVARKDYQRREHPTELLLVIEVADSSLRRDRGVKLDIYAEAGVPEYWIVDVNTTTVAVHTTPTADGYQTIRTVRDGDVLRPTQLPGVELQVVEIPR